MTKRELSIMNRAKKLHKEADEVSDKQYDLLQPIVEPAIKSEDIPVLRVLYRHLPDGYWRHEMSLALRKLRPDIDFREVIREILRSKSPAEEVLSRRKAAIIKRAHRLEKLWQKMSYKEIRLLEIIVEPAIDSRDENKLAEFLKVMPPGGWRADVRGTLASIAKEKVQENSSAPKTE